MRFYESEAGLEVSYRVSFEDFTQLDEAKRAIEAIDPGMRISFVDNDAIL